MTNKANNTNKATNSPSINNTNKADSATATTTTQKSSNDSLISKNRVLTLTISWEKASQAYKKALAHFQEHAELEGFRKGKAPAPLVESRVGKAKLYEEALSLILPETYAEELKKTGAKPIAYPHFSVKSAEEGKEWVVEAEIAEAPEVVLGDYKKITKQALSKGKIWLPGKDTKDDKKAPTDEEKLRSIFQALLEKIKIKIPELLIQEGVNRSLSQLVDQLERLHIPLQDYLNSVKKTAEQIRTEYATQALATLQLDFLLETIAAEEKLGVSDKEISEVLASIPDEKIRKANDTPQQKARIESSLKRQKTLQFLLSL